MTERSINEKSGKKNTLLVGAPIKTGTTGTKPKVTKIIWRGTAEALIYGCNRVPAALVETDRGVMAIVQLAGTDMERWQWWDARVISSREWEGADHDLVGDTQPEIAAQIDTFFRTTTENHERYGRELNARVARGDYSVAH